MFRDHELEKTPARSRACTAEEREKERENPAPTPPHSPLPPPTKGHISFLYGLINKNKLFIPIRSSSVFFDRHCIGRVFMPRGREYHIYIEIGARWMKKRDDGTGQQQAATAAVSSSSCPYVHVYASKNFQPPGRHVSLSFFGSSLWQKEKVREKQVTHVHTHLSLLEISLPPHRTCMMPREE